MKRTMIILLVVLLTITMAVPAAATTEENIIQPKWSYFTAITANLDINWLGVASFSGSAQVNGAYTVKTVVYLRQYKDGQWTTLKSVSSTSVSTCGAEGRLAVESGCTYQAYVIAYVYDANGNVLETISYADTVTY